ncbi:hypothetical protein I4U23_027428 [Adineta vaga]|nr:hypothetical protein I4U23_027428 [Adineta vaga]
MKRFSDNSIYPLSITILDRFISQILLSIHHKIQWFDVESSNKTNLTDLLQNQITSLSIYTRTNERGLSTENENTIIFTNIFTMFINLKYLNFKSFSNFTQYLSFKTLSPNINCPNLVELHVNV